MRIGSGGVMLPHYSPLKVAESFSVLSGLYGDRIDLGVGGRPDPIREPHSRSSATVATRPSTTSRSSSPS